MIPFTRRDLLRPLAVLALLLLAAPPALADGKVFRPAHAAPVAIPDQEALIVFDAARGRQTLTIETRFDPGATAPAGPTDYAWVVPLPGPAAPAVRPATPGLFPSLRQAFAPAVITRAGQTTPATFALSMAILLFLLAGAASAGRLRIIPFALTLLACLIVLAVFLPSLGKARSSAGGAAGVNVLDRQIAGSYEVTIITAEASGPAAGRGAGHRLAAWLRDAGFVIPDGAEPVLTDYAAKGWVFAACKLTVDPTPGPAGAPRALPAPHPLIFQFDTTQAVYPMRLTGVGNGPLAVDLYVFSAARASAPGFEVARCEPEAELLHPDEHGSRWLTGARVTTGHPLIRELAAGFPVATRLTATLPPAAQRDDVVLSWSPAAKSGARVYSSDAADNSAIEAGGAALLAGLIVAVLVGASCSKTCLYTLRYALVAFAVAAAVGAVRRSLLPVYDGPTHARGSWRPSESDHEHVAGSLAASMSPASDAAALRAAADRAWRAIVTDAHRPGSRHPPKLPPRHEDSPDNYTIEPAADGGFDYVAYDAAGMPKRHPLDRPR